VIGVPFDAAGSQVTTIVDPDGVAVTPVGAPGTAAGVTLLEGFEAGPVPTPLVAVTVKV